MNDIFEEVTRQMNSLKRQASKAERYAKLREEMRAQLRVVLASKFAAIDQESAELDGQLNLLAEDLQHRTGAVQQLESEHGEGTERGYAIDSELRENRDRLSQIDLEIDRARARRQHNDERCAELVSLARLLPHKGLDATQIQDDADLDGRALRDGTTRQDARAECTGAGREDLATIDRYTLAHFGLLFPQ